MRLDSALNQIDHPNIAIIGFSIMPVNEGKDWHRVGCRRCNVSYRYLPFSPQNSSSIQELCNYLDQVAMSRSGGQNVIRDTVNIV